MYNTNKYDRKIIRNSSFVEASTIFRIILLSLLLSSLTCLFIIINIHHIFIFFIDYWFLYDTSTMVNLDIIMENCYIWYRIFVFLSCGVSGLKSFGIFIIFFACDTNLSRHYIMRNVDFWVKRCHMRKSQQYERKQQHKRIFASINWNNEKRIWLDGSIFHPFYLYKTIFD